MADGISFRSLYNLLEILCPHSIFYHKLWVVGSKVFIPLVSIRFDSHEFNILTELNLQKSNTVYLFYDELQHMKVRRCLTLMYRARDCKIFHNQ